MNKLSILLFFTSKKKTCTNDLWRHIRGVYMLDFKNRATIAWITAYMPIPGRITHRCKSDIKGPKILTRTAVSSIRRSGCPVNKHENYESDSTIGVIVFGYKYIPCHLYRMCKSRERTVFDTFVYLESRVMSLGIRNLVF